MIIKEIQYGSPKLYCHDPAKISAKADPMRCGHYSTLFE